MDKLAQMQTLMNNKEVLSLRIVTTPEKIVIQEAKHNFTWNPCIEIGSRAAISSSKSI